MSEINNRLFVTQATLDLAIKLHSSGHLAASYAVLAAAGDDYSAAAHQIVDDYSAFDPFGYIVHSVWERNAPGAADKLFKVVASDHQENYLNLIKNNPLPGDGKLYVLPSSFNIETSYLSALQKNGLPASAAIDILLNTAFGGKPQWALLLNLLQERISSQNLVVEGVPPGVALQNLFQAAVGGIFELPHCFPAGTPITLLSGQTRDIVSLRPGDEVASFDGSEELGRGSFATKRVTRVFENITDSWVKLSNGLTVTPGHHFLDPFGTFRPIADILATDGQIVLEDSSVTKVSGEFIHYSSDTASQFEEAEGYATPTVGGLALAPVYKRGWKTYNFEVEDLHTYVAGGVRVHNASVFTATGKDLTVGTLYSGDNGYTYEVNADGSLTNQQTGHTSPGGAFSPAKFKSADAASLVMGPITPAKQYELANDGAFAKYQITGSGPAVRLASGGVTTAGTVFYTGDGAAYRVNANGSVTSLDTDHTYGVGQVRYNADTKQFEQVTAPQSARAPAQAAQPNAGQISPTSVPTAPQNQNPAAAAAYDSGHSSYVSSDGRVLPTTTINGDQRNTYGDHSSSSSGGSIFNNPVILDLDGNGFDITPVSSSNIFIDTAGDGTQHRTA